MEKVILTGNNLTVEEVWEIAVNGAKVEISAEAQKKLEDARAFVMDILNSDTPVYGLNRGVGWNKDRKIENDDLADFNRKLIYSHTLGIAPEASEEEVRSVMAVRLNTLLCAHTGVDPAVARRYADFLNAGIHPVMPERGSVGEADITLCSHIGLAMMGEGEVNYKGRRIPAAEALKGEGLQPSVFGPKDAHAIVCSNAFAAGQAALLLKELSDLADTGDIVSSVALEGLNGNVSPLDPSALRERRLEGQQTSAARVRKYLEGSYICEPDPERALQDPLCYRGAVHLNGTLREAIEYARKYLDVQMNTTDDNPCVLTEERRMVAGSNFEVTSLATAFEMLAIICSHLSHMSCYRMIKLADPALTKLPRFLSHDGGQSHCFGTIQKAFTSLDTEIRLLANPCSPDFMPLAGDIEDHANNTTLVVQKLRRIADDLKYIYGMEMMHACQAVELRMRGRKMTLGKGTGAAYAEFRKRLPLYESDRPLSPDIKKAYEFIKEGVLLKEVRDKF